MPTLTVRERAATRALDAIYRHFAVPSQLILLSGTVIPVRGKMRVNDAEEGLDGSSIEVRLKGYSTQIRRSELGDNTAPLRGARLELLDDRTFEGVAAFNVDGEPRSFGRDGLQLLLKLSAAPDVADEDLA